ncbi:MAG: nuclear transport factor 2 family protein [Actinomycetota bacterium]|nr:nuclear transport factor 2 family protein [Actinomycetota bacterium]
MSQENVEMVRSIYAVGPPDFVSAYSDPEFVRGMEQAFSLLLDPEIDFLPPGPGFAPSRGIAGYWKSMREWLAMWETYSVEAERFIDAGDAVVVVTRERGRSRSAGVEVEQSAAAVWRIQDGRITSMRNYYDQSEALQAAGLSE